MAYDVSALPAYTKQDATKIIYEKIFDAIPTVKYCNIQTGVKTAETINIISSDFELQTADCAFNASGSTTLTQRTITVGKTKINGEWCEDDLETKFTSEALKKGSTYTSLTFNTQIIDNTLAKVRQKIERTIWLGNTASGDQTLKQFDGFVKIINAATIGGTYSGTSWSEATSRTVMKGIAALVVGLADVYQGGDNTDIKIFCSPAVAQAYRWKLVNDNVGFAGAYDLEKKVYIEGTNMEIVEAPGLAGTNYIYAMETSNMYVGTDMENEYEKLKIWFSDDNQKIRMVGKWKIGCQVAFPLRIVKYLGV